MQNGSLKNTTAAAAVPFQKTSSGRAAINSRKMEPLAMQNGKKKSRNEFSLQRTKQTSVVRFGIPVITTNSQDIHAH